MDKSGSKADVSNYRPTPIIPYFSDIWIINEKSFNTILNKMKIKKNRWFGFIPGFSNFDAIKTYISDFHITLNKRKSILSVFLDFRKDLHTKQPHIFRFTMYKYGFHGYINDCFISDLINRQQYADFNNNLFPV